MSKNSTVAQLLTNIADLLEAQNENLFKIQAYRVAAQSIDTLDEDIEAVHREGKLRDVPGVGEGIAKKIAEFLDKGRLKYYDDLKKNAPKEFEQLVRIEGLGPKRALALFKALAIETVMDLKAAALANKVANVPGFGAKSQAKILEKLEQLERGGRVPYRDAKKQAETILTQLRKQTQVVRAEIAGSLRRKKKTIGDIDIIAAVTNLEKVAAYFAKLPQIESIIARGPSKVSVHLKSGRQCDLRLVTPAQFGAAWLYFTGSKACNIELRKIAQARGWKLNEYGLFDQNNNVIVQKTEEEIYEKLGFVWIPPEQREQLGWMQKYEKRRKQKTATKKTHQSVKTIVSRKNNPTE